LDDLAAVFENPLGVSVTCPLVFNNLPALLFFTLLHVELNTPPPLPFAKVLFFFSRRNNFPMPQLFVAFL
jgi:hypothetical protein